ncbi:MAG: hypothetical protein R3F07_14515 [Opitutaceae bacterium]
MILPDSPAHRWRFFRAGSLDQAKFETAGDFTRLETLDLKLWVALSCPTRGIDFDPTTLDLIDTDDDGRIRAPELIAAVKWTTQRLRDPAELTLEHDRLPLDSINDQTLEGRALRASAIRVLKNLGKPDATFVTPEDTRDTARILARTNFNGDGIISIDASDDESIRDLIREIMDTVGPVADGNGIPGINLETVARFYGDLAAFEQWWSKGDEVSREGTAILPLGDQTPTGYEAYAAVKTKITDFFNRCRLAAYDNRALEHLNRPQSEYIALAPKDLSTVGPDVEDLPLQKIQPVAVLDLVTGLNPAWSERIADFRRKVIEPLFGEDKDQLEVGEWNEIGLRFNVYEEWVTHKAGSSVEKLGIERIRSLLTGPGRAAVETLIARDTALAPEAAGIGDVNKLVLYYRDLARLLRNFVSFQDFYNPDTWATFQAGTLYLDQRGCNLCVEVTDPAAHSILGSLSRMYIAYCDLRRPNGQTAKIAACFTQGDSDYLMVGRNGIFYDRKGRDWDAHITKVVDFPISVRQAFFQPYKKFVRFIEEQVTKRAAAAQAEADAKLEATALAKPGDPKPELLKPKKIDVGTVAALGVAISGFVSVFTAIIGGILGLHLWQIPVAVIGVLLAISGPSMLIAWLKLRQRTLGPILDANGWAINGRIKVNVSLATRLTDAKRLPPNASRQINDPYQRRRVWPAVAVGLIVIAAGGYAFFAHRNSLWPFAKEAVVEPVVGEAAK